MKRLLSSLFLLPLALAGCVVVAPDPGPGPGPGPGRPGMVVATPAPAIVFAPAVRPYVYSVATISPHAYQVRYLPPHVTQVQVLAGFRNQCAAQGLRPVAGHIRLVPGNDRRNRPANFRVMTVYCR